MRTNSKQIKIFKSEYIFLWAKQLLRKAEIVENFITTFYTLNVGLFANIKKNYFEDYVSETRFKTEYFCCLLDLTKCLK